MLDGVETMLNDQQIKELALAGMIDPFVSHQVREKKDGYKVISFGLSAGGYDIRCTNKFKIFRPIYGGSSIVDPKDFNTYLLEDFKGSACFIPPNSYVLTYSVERFDMPKDVVGTVVGKSTYARCGIIVNVTPLEPEWKGYLTIEISNASSLPAKIYADEGIAQVQFHRIKLPNVTYADRGGKYQDQPAEIVMARL